MEVSIPLTADGLSFNFPGTGSWSLKSSQALASICLVNIPLDL